MTRLLRVLIVEDSEDDATMVLDELRRGGFEVDYVRVETAEAMRVALVEQTWDVIMADYSMPTFTGIGALSVLKETGLDIPIIIASGTIGEETAVEALKAGASDFLVKDRLARLIPAIERETREAAGRRARHAAEKALSQTRERMQFALEAAGVGTGETEFPSGRTSWSEVLEQLHGLHVGGFGGTFDAFVECIHPDDRQRVQDSIAESLRERRDARLEYRAKWPDGSTHWIVGIGRTFYSEGGEPIRAAGVGIDTTAQKNLEEQFRQAQKLEAIGGLAAGVAHDFNNLLTAILGYCDLLLDDAADDARRADVEEIKKAGINAASLTSRLLTFSRKQIVEPKILDLNAVVADTGDMLQRMVGEDVEIAFNRASGLGLVKADPGQMNQVLMNLVVNARDAMPQGGRLTVETANVDLDESYAGTRFSVLPGPGAVVRAVFHDEGAWQRNRTRTGQRVWDRQAERGQHLGLQRAWPRHDLQGLPAKGERVRSDRRPGPCFAVNAHRYGDDPCRRGQQQSANTGSRKFSTATAIRCCRQPRLTRHCASVTNITARFSCSSPTSSCICPGPPGGEGAAGAGRGGQQNRVTCHDQLEAVKEGVVILVSPTRTAGDYGKLTTVC